MANTKLVQSWLDDNGTYGVHEQLVPGENLVQTCTNTCLKQDEPGRTRSYLACTLLLLESKNKLHIRPYHPNFGVTGRNRVKWDKIWEGVTWTLVCCKYPCQKTYSNILKLCHGYWLFNGLGIQRAIAILLEFFNDSCLACHAINWCWRKSTCLRPYQYCLQNAIDILVSINITDHSPHAFYTFPFKNHKACKGYVWPSNLNESRRHVLAAQIKLYIYTYTLTVNPTTY